MTPASIRTNNPGAQWYGPIAQAFGATGQENLSDGNNAALFPDPVSGAAAQFGLLKKKYAGMTLADAIQKWSGGNSSPAYANFISDQTGLPSNAVLSHDLLSGPQGLSLAKAQAHWEAGRPFPMSDEDWAKAQARVYGSDPNAAPIAQATQAADDGALLPAQAKPTGFEPKSLSMTDRLGALGNGIEQAGAALQSINNPSGGAMLKQVAQAKLMANKAQFGVIGQDIHGRNKYGFVNPTTGSIVPADQVMGGAASGSVDPNQSRYDQMDKPQKGVVDAMIEGRQPLPSGTALKTPYWLSMIEAADERAKSLGQPGFDASNWQQRVQTARDFGTGGKSGQNIIGMDTLDQHLEKLSNATEKLDNGGWTILNQLRNGIAANTPLDPSRRKAYQEVTDTSKAVIDEMGRAWKSGVLSDTEIKDWGKRFNDASSKEQQHQALADFTDLVDGKRAALIKSYSGVMGKPLPPQYDPSEHNRITGIIHKRNANLASEPSADVPSLSEIFK